MPPAMPLPPLPPCDDAAEKTHAFAKLLDSDSALDERRLRLESSSGVPAPLRASVWPLLLRATRSAPLEMQSRFRPLAAQFDLDGVVAAAVRREVRDIGGVRTPRGIKRFLSVVGAWCGVAPAGLGVDGVADVVRVAAVVLKVCEGDEDAFAVLCGVMRRVDVFYGAGLDGAVRDFLMLFKSLVPDVHEMFVEMDVEVGTWAVSALRGLLCREMQSDCSARLLDCYLARDEEDWTCFHLHVCVAVLAIMYERDEFSEVDSETLLARLQDLPSDLPVDVVVNRAVNFQQDSEADGFVRAVS